MVPPHLMQLDAMPLTGNGKVDRQSLPAPAVGRSASEKAQLALGTQIESKLLAIWKELLNIKDIGVDENFFDLGGDSLLALRAVTRVREAFAVDLPPLAVIDNPTVAALAKTVSDLSTAG
jgi:acyl carrier protein